jgi:hypothetical protein
MHRLIHFIAASLLLLSSSLLAQEDISGVWEGVLVVGTTEIDVEFTLTADGAGGYSAIMDAPDQPSITNMAVDSVTFTDNALTMTIAAVSGQYSGTLTGGTIAGTWTQQGQDFTLNLAPYEEPTMTAETFALVAGQWIGSIKPMPNAEMELTVVLDFKEDEPGVYTASLSSPDQGAQNIPVDSFAVEDDELTVEINRMRLEIITNIAGEQMTGNFTQAGRNIPITLNRGEYTQQGLNIPALTYARLQGPWHAEVQGLNVQIRIEQQGDTFFAYLDSPDQGASDIPISSLALEQDTLTFAVTAAGMNFNGELANDQIVGTWSQMGTDTAVTFVRGPYNASANLDAAASQQLIGTWSGTVNNTELVFEFSEANGSVSGSLSIPAMGAQGLGLSELAGNSDAMSFSVRGIQATFAGSLDGDSLSGEWSRAGSTNPLNLSRN